MNDINDGTGSYPLQVFQVGSCVATVGIGRVDALCGEVVELLEVGIHYYLLLVGVLEWLGARDGTFTTGGDGSAASQTSHVSPEDIHEDSLGNVVRVVSSHDLVHTEDRCPAVKSLPTEDAAEGAVVPAADRRHDAVHSPAVEVLVGEYLERDPVLALVPPHRLQGVVSVACDPLVDGEKKQVQSVVVPLVQGLHEIGQHRGVLATRRSDGYYVTSLEQSMGNDGLMDLCLHGFEETLLAGSVARLGSLEDGRTLIAESTLHWHLFWLELCSQ